MCTKEDLMRSSYWKTKKPMKISVSIVLSSIVIVSLCGAGASQDISSIKQDGTECTFRARILEKTGDKAMVVKKIPTTDVREKRILVLIAKDTKIGYQVHGPNPRWQDVAFNDLKEETHVLIKGFQVIEKEGDQEIIVVGATHIEFSE
jgi:hypothetical protein